MSRPSDRSTPGFRWSNWNLLLLVPLIFLFTPLFNKTSPALFGMPFYYWFQLFVGVGVGVVCTSIVYRMTRNTGTVKGLPDKLDVDELDEGSAK